MNDEMILVFEFADLIYYDEDTSGITVDKSVFDDFVKDSCIDIRFVDGDYEYLGVYTYKMVAEDEDAIYMVLME